MSIFALDRSESYNTVTFKNCIARLLNLDENIVSSMSYDRTSEKDREFRQFSATQHL